MCLFPCQLQVTVFCSPAKDSGEQISCAGCIPFDLLTPLISSALGITAAAWDQDRNKKNGEVRSQALKLFPMDVFQNHLVGFIIDEAHCIKKFTV